MEACLAATDWCRANYEYFRGGGFSSHFTTAGRDAGHAAAASTLSEGVGPVLQIAEGYTADAARAT